MAIESVITIVIGLEDAPDAVSDIMPPYEDGPRGPEKLAQLLTSLASGNKKGVVMAYSDEADGTEPYVKITCTQASAVAEDTVTVFGVVLTAKTSGASPVAQAGEFNIGADDDALTDNLIIAINSHPYLRDIVHASEDGASTSAMYLQFRCPGPFNMGTVATSNSDAFLVGAGASATPAGGAVGTEQDNVRGWRCGLHGSDPGQLTSS